MAADEVEEVALVEVSRLQRLADAPPPESDE